MRIWVTHGLVRELTALPHVLPAEVSETLGAGSSSDGTTCRAMARPTAQGRVQGCTMAETRKTKCWPRRFHVKRNRLTPGDAAPIPGCGRELWRRLRYAASSDAQTSKSNVTAVFDWLRLCAELLPTFQQLRDPQRTATETCRRSRAQPPSTAILTWPEVPYAGNADQPSGGT